MKDGMNSFICMAMKIELPFNFNKDQEYFNLLDTRKSQFENIDCIYLPTFESGSMNTRENMITYPETEKEYRKYIREFQDRDLGVNILMQKNITFDTIRKYYLNYGINDFTINDHAIASEIKEKYPDIKLRLSITAKATPEDINSSILDPYDNIVLFFWYNRHLDIIKELPKNHNYTVLCNTLCLWNCPYCETHWFGNDILKISGMCGPKKILWGDTLNFKNTAYIRPEDIKYFEDYVSVFKLEGREKKSSHIFHEFDEYITGTRRVGSRPIYGFDESDILSNYNIEKNTPQ